MSDEFLHATYRIITEKSHVTLYTISLQQYQLHGEQVISWSDAYLLELLLLIVYTYPRLCMVSVNVHMWNSEQNSVCKNVPHYDKYNIQIHNKSIQI